MLDVAHVGGQLHGDAGIMKQRTAVLMQPAVSSNRNDENTNRPDPKNRLGARKVRFNSAKCTYILILPIIGILTFQPSAASAQHAADNPITSADDAYGLTLGLESVGLYGPGLVRGFNPQAAGNVRIDGLYFDQQGGLSNRIVEGSVIRVGVSEIGYAFPAPTGIVDYDLRRVGGDAPTATVITNVGPYDAWGVSVDGSAPVMGDALVFPFGAGVQVSTLTPYGPYPGYTSSVVSAGATPQWSPNGKITIRGIFDWQQTTAAKTFPLFYTAGDFRPPAISNGYRGENWANGRNETLNLGGIISAKLTEVWSLKAGVFRSTNDAPVSFADLYTDVQPNGQSEHVIVGYPDQNVASTSGEARLTGGFGLGDWRQQIVLMARGRDTTARYGGQDAVDAGPADIAMPIQTPRPEFFYSTRADDHTQLWSAGAAYHLAWRHSAEFEAGVQQESYRESVIIPGAAASEVSAHPIRIYGNIAVALGPRWSIYSGYTQGLETSGSAPASAANGGEVLPASKTWQIDGGLRFAITPKLKIVAGMFDLQKPYFNVGANNIDKQLGVQEAKGAELSIAGELFRGLHVNVGVLDGKVGISGPNLAAEGVGPVAVGQPRLMYVANVNYTLPWLPAASVDASVTHFGAQPESLDNRVYSPAVSQVNVGERYNFIALGRKGSLRVQVQNVMGANMWTNVYTPGFFRYPGPRTVFAYLTVDIP